MVTGKKGSNKNLHDANRAKKDEFYTQLTDIEKELGHYKEHFKGKVVFCNCDDPTESNFWKYFTLNFKFLGLKKLIATHYEEDEPSYKLEMVKDEPGTTRTELKQNGDFRSPECIEILKEVDIVVTNPPFSLFREYVAQLIEYKKKLIILGNMNAITYKEIFKLMKENKIWLGISPRSMNFKTPSGGTASVNACWFTNLDYKERHEELDLYKKYSENEYPKYDNYNAINVDKTKDIPMDYGGVMGVPITFMDKYNPEQFVILGNSNVTGEREHLMNGVKSATNCTYINGKPQYARVLIKRVGVTE